jgi:nucleoside phosphorylase
MKILVIDDDDAKRALLISTLTSFGVQVADIEPAKSAASARKLFTERNFDIAILDLVLPVSDKSGNPSPDIGFGLLQELTDEAAAKRIVGVTSHAEALSEFEPGFRDLTEQLLFVAPDTLEWKESLRLLVGQAQALASKKPTYDVDICFVCALRAPEYQSVLELEGITWGAEQVLAGHTLFKKGSLQAGERTLSVVAAHSKSMGMVAACHLTKTLIETFRPKTLVMTGFCGGLPGEVELGDVIIAERSWDWQSGKWTDTGFEQAPDQKEASGELVALAKSLESESVEFMRIVAHHRNPGRAPKFRDGPMLTGSAVVTDEELHEMFAKQHRKAIAVDMECYGVYYSAYYAEEPKPLFLCVKTVADLCGGAKGKEFQQYGSALSAKVAMKVLLNHFAAGTA